MKHNNVFLAVTFYDTINYKFLWISITNSDQLMKLVHSHRFNILLQNVNKVCLYQESLQKIMLFLEKLKIDLLAHILPNYRSISLLIID